MISALGPGLVNSSLSIPALCRYNHGTFSRVADYSPFIAAFFSNISSRASLHNAVFPTTWIQQAAGQGPLPAVYGQDPSDCIVTGNINLLPQGIHLDDCHLILVNVPVYRADNRGISQGLHGVQLFIIALCLTIRRIPSARTMVTTAGKPSGAATARLTRS